MPEHDVPTRALRAHDAYTQPLGGGYLGYQARCWDCDWRGAEYLRGDELMGTEASRVHKLNAKREATEHRETTSQIPCCSKCKVAL